MGGNALGVEKYPRLTREQYSIISQQLCCILKKYYKIVELPRILKEKQSFGDVDILVFDQFQDFLPERDLSSKKVVHNNKVLSFEYNGFQIDVINHSFHPVTLVKFHYDYCDIAVLLGMIVKKIGLKLSIRGLHVILKNGKIFLTANIKSIFSFLGLDYILWEKGFLDQQEIFDFISSTKYFRKHFFSIEGRNSREKHDLLTRPMIINFYQYVNNEDYSPHDEIINIEKVKHDAIVFFGKQDYYDTLLNEEKQKSIIYEKFNGNLVRQWTNLKGKDLGCMMKHLNETLSRDELLKSSQEEIQSHTISLCSGVNF